MTEATTPTNFIRQIVAADQASGKHAGVVQTRFPPEPNGYLHLGHAKSICLNFGVAQDFSGTCNLRFDDTNPSREDVEFVEAIREDVKWLGFDWAEQRHASDYFEVFYRCAIKLIEDGKAFVCDLSAEEVREYRGTLVDPGRNSPYRNRSVEENLDLFTRMRDGEFDDGARTLRAMIDMTSGNINLRDPAIFRIRKISHQNTGDAWPIYPMYDYAHCISDAVEGITHSLCTLEFEDHRPLYDWCLDQIDLVANPQLAESIVAAGLSYTPRRPQQIEFARGNLDYTVMSKRKLMTLVQERLVDGWDDPRMPTLTGARRRGFPAAAIRLFWERAGISKQNSVIEYGVLEGCVREVLDGTAARRMGVINPIKLTLVNLDGDHAETLDFPNHPKNEDFGRRSVSFSPDLWIERDDFLEEPIKGFHRLVPGGEVRLRGAGIIRCDEVVKNAAGEVVELRCNLDPDTRPGGTGANRKIKGTIHWVDARTAIAAEIRLYDRLFDVANPDDDSEGKTYRDHLNPHSRRVIKAWLECGLADVAAESVWQFERLGYFVADRRDHTQALPVFNRVVTLRDTWAKAIQ